MDKLKLFHILYADEQRLDSLDAQLHGEVPIRKTEQESLKTSKTLSGEGGIPTVLKGSMGTAEHEESTLSHEYHFRDARYFKILNDLGIDLTSPLTSLPTPDGEIYVLAGKLRVVSMSSSQPMIETVKAFATSMTKNPAVFGLKNDKELRVNTATMNAIADLALKIPAPPSLLLVLESGEKIYGPVNEPAVRLPLVDQTIVFGSSLPFDWIVVGYIYPMENKEPSSDASFLFLLANALEDMRTAIIPEAQAIIIPLLILR